MAWEIEGTDQFETWFLALDPDARRAVIAAVDALEQAGPGLGRPFVDTIKSSRHSNMKELRPPRGDIRVLFAFDPRRVAILLIGGDKRLRWNRWYDEMIPLADMLYDDYPETLEREGLLP